MGILLSAYQKYYSALSNLDRFSKENDFFDNISCLDAFFSEYRNITFVIQKSISKDEVLNEIYTRLRDKHLKNPLSKWLLDKRNETIKQHPFELEKKIYISVYLPNATLV